MSSVVVLAKLNQPLVSQSRILDLHRSLRETLTNASGLTACTAWQAQSESQRYMVLTEYANDEEAARGLEAAQLSSFFIDATNAFTDPIDLSRSNVAFQHGYLGADVPIGQFMSHSNRSADPGKSGELVSELIRIFGELAAIDGYLGSAIGQNQNLEEEVEGIVFWDRVEAYMSSLPIKLLYEVHLYHRIG